MTSARNQSSGNQSAAVTAGKKTDGLYRKILAVQQKMESVPKRGYNSFHKYHYATEADILSVKDILNKNGLVVLPTTIHEETGFKPDGKSWASVTLLFKVVDVETGETIESQFTGYAEDSFDKAIYKATTGANKYFYLKFFGIATEDDPERDEAPPATRGIYSGQPRGDGGYSARGGTEPGRSAGERNENVEAGPADGEGVSGNRSATQRNQALVNANKILALQKQAGLSNEEVLRFGEIESIRDLAEEGNAERLAQAYLKIAAQVRHLQKTL